MKKAQTYWEYAQECMQLARSMPQHRAKLLDMASVWTDLAAKAEARERSDQKAKDKNETT
jgi:hypothetical protein